MNVSTVAGNVVKSYLAKFPKTPSLTLAKLIAKAEPNLLKTRDQLRDIIRYHRGNAGAKDRKVLSDRTFVRPPTSSTNPFDQLPEGLTDFSEWTSYPLPFLKTLMLCDAHVPYHDRKALALAIQDGKEQGCESVLLNGDFADFYALSFWEKDPRKRNFKDELEKIQIVLDIINSTLQPKKIYYKLGNHEDRLIRYMRVKAPEMLGIEAFEFENLINAKEHNVEIIKDKRIVKFGKHLNIIHGHEFGGDGVFSPVNPARGLYMRGKECAIAGHNHQTSQHTETTMAGSLIATWSVGCLSDLHPEYKPLNKWNHGFCIITPSGKEGFQVENKKIIDGRIYS